MSREVALLAAGGLPALFQRVPEGGRRFCEFFTVNIRSPNTRRAYFKAV
jgi:integrase/recombinase XerD